MIGRAIQWISAGELAILLLTSPLFLFFRPSLAPVLLLLPALWVARSRRNGPIRGHFVPRTPVDWPILGLLTMTLISMLVIPDPVSSLDKIVGLIYAIAVFYALVDWGQRQQSGLPVALVVVVLGAGTAILALLGTQWGVKWSLMEGIIPHLPQVVSDLPGAESGFNPNTVSGTLILFVPLQLSLLWGVVSDDSMPRTKRGSFGPHQRLALGIALSLVPTVGVALLAQSRAAWAALILGLLGLGLCGQATSFRRKPIPMDALSPQNRRRSFAVGKTHVAFILIVVVALIVLTVLGPVGVIRWLVQQGWMTGSTEVSWSARVEVWSRGLWAIADFPLTGMGMDTFRRSTQLIYPFFHMPQGQDLGHAHNIFLQVALDLGIPGLISYLALLGGTLAVGCRTYKQPHPGGTRQSRLNRLIVLGGIVGLATHAAWSLVDALPLGARTSFLWWTMLALVVTIVIRDAASSAEQAQAAQERRRPQESLAESQSWPTPDRASVPTRDSLLWRTDAGDEGPRPSVQTGDVHEENRR